MDETKIEKLLNIKTSGRDDTRANTFNYPYEPTEYAVLERLVQSGLIKKNTFSSIIRGTIMDEVHNSGWRRPIWQVIYKVKRVPIHIVRGKRLL